MTSNPVGIARQLLLNPKVVRRRVYSRSTRLQRQVRGATGTNVDRCTFMALFDVNHWNKTLHNEDTWAEQRRQSSGAEGVTFVMALIKNTSEHTPNNAARGLAHRYPFESNILQNARWAHNPHDLPLCVSRDPEPVTVIKQPQSEPMVQTSVYEKHPTLSYTPCSIPHSIPHYGSFHFLFHYSNITLILPQCVTTDESPRAALDVNLEFSDTTASLNCGPHRRCPGPHRDACSLQLLKTKPYNSWTLGDHGVGCLLRKGASGLCLPTDQQTHHDP